MSSGHAASRPNRINASFVVRRMGGAKRNPSRRGLDFAELRQGARRWRERSEPRLRKNKLECVRGGICCYAALCDRFKTWRSFSFTSGFRSDVCSGPGKVRALTSCLYCCAAAPICSARLR